ncbi:MAG: DUF2202 domain-containing protein [Spirochaetaceae bacterium]|nr:DUF2202 domain-containing protein [Spirochaetaceae bacterium]
MDLEEALYEALDDEYRARATYRAVLALFGEVRPFANIVESEGRHIEALAALYRRRGLPVPEDRWAGRVEAPESVAAACELGIAAEVENAALYDRLLEAARGEPDVEAVFQRLREASQTRHLPAFQRGLERERGGSGRGEGRRGGRRARWRGGEGK